MPIHYTSGEIMMNPHEAQALAQGCNAVGIMNTQLNSKFGKKYPLMVQEYEQLCESDPPQFQLGDAFLWRANDGTWVFNLAVHENEFYAMAEPDVIEKAFREMRRKADEAEITSIAMPPVGGGVGLLWWEEARQGLEKAFHDWEGKLFVYIKLPKPETPPEAKQQAEPKPVKKTDDESGGKSRSKSKSRRGGRRGGRRSKGSSSGGSSGSSSNRGRRGGRRSRRGNRNKQNQNQGDDS